jgi:excisionase family DNA binding protein
VAQGARDSEDLSGGSVGDRVETTEWLTIEEVTQDLKLAASTVYALLKSKKDPIPHIKLGKKSIRVPAVEYREWLKRKIRQ